MHGKAWIGRHPLSLASPETGLDKHLTGQAEGRVGAAAIIGTVAVFLLQQAMHAIAACEGATTL